MDIDHLLKLTTAARDEAVDDGRPGPRHDELMAYLAGALARSDAKLLRSPPVAPRPGAVAHVEMYDGKTFCGDHAYLYDGVDQAHWHRDPAAVVRCTCRACAARIVALGDAARSLYPGVEVVVHDVDLMRRQVCDRVHQHVLGRIAALERQPALVDVVRNRREGALAELRLLDAELLPAVRRVGGVAPTEDELRGVELDLLSARTLPVRRSTVDLLRRLLASCGR